MRCKGFTLIKGPVGVGKSLFLRKLSLNIQEDLMKKKNMKFKHDENISIITSSINSKTSKYKCNGMKKPIKVLFHKLMKRQAISIDSHKSKFEFLYKIIPSLVSQSQDI